MVQLVERAPVPELASLRQELHLPTMFEFKYHKTTQRQKEAFFRSVQKTLFRVRAVVIDKSGVEHRFANVSGQDLTWVVSAGGT